MSTMSKRELKRRLKGLAPEQAKVVACACIGHSDVVSTCFGYVYCGRCEAQIGDTLGGVSDLSRRVIIGHDCDACRTNAMQLDWTDTFLVDEAAVFPNDPDEEAS